MLHLLHAITLLGGCLAWPAYQLWSGAQEGKARWLRRISIVYVALQVPIVSLVIYCRNTSPDYWACLVYLYLVSYATLAAALVVLVLPRSWFGRRESGKAGSWFLRIKG
jgi:hypothetical protein